VVVKRVDNKAKKHGMGTNFGGALDGIGELFQWFKRRGEVYKTFMRGSISARVQTSSNSNLQDHVSSSEFSGLNTL
jgi:hypothetical protein